MRKLTPGENRPKDFVTVMCGVCFRQLAVKIMINEKGEQTIRSPWTYSPLFGFCCHRCEAELERLGQGNDKKNQKNEKIYNIKN
jgi:hypothetical protein